MILKNKTISRSYDFHSINNIISFCNQIISKYTLYKTKSIGFPFLYLLKHKPFLHYYIFKNIINLSLKTQVYNIGSKQQISACNAQAVYRGLSVLPFVHFSANLVINKTQADISIKKFPINPFLKSNLSESKVEGALNFLEKKPLTTKTLGLTSKINKALEASNEINKETSNISNENVHYLSRMSLIVPGFVEKDIPKIQENIFLYKKAKYIKSKDKFREIRFLSVHNAQVGSRYSRVSIATLPIFSGTDLSINKILSNQLQANVLIKKFPTNSILESQIEKSLNFLGKKSFTEDSDLTLKASKVPEISNISNLSRTFHKAIYIKPKDKFKEAKKTEFIFLDLNKQLNEIRHTIQKRINRKQPKEEVVSVTLNKDRNALKSRDFQNMVDQVYKLILKRWQKDLERRGIFHA